MSVESILKQLVDHSPAILAGAIRQNARVDRVATGPYAVADCGVISDRLTGIFVLMEQVEDRLDRTENLYVEFDSHGLFGLRLDDAVLAVITEPLTASGLDKIRTGLEIFRKPLARALNEAEATPVPKAEAPKKRRRFYRGIPVED